MKTCRKEEEYKEIERYQKARLHDGNVLFIVLHFVLSSVRRKVFSRFEWKESIGTNVLCSIAFNYLQPIYGKVSQDATDK